jgi:hypothetical protein
MVGGRYPLFVEENRTNKKNLANVGPPQHRPRRVRVPTGMDRRERHTDIALAILAGASVLGIVLIRRVS